MILWECEKKNVVLNSDLEVVMCGRKNGSRVSVVAESKIHLQ